MVKTGRTRSSQVGINTGQSSGTYAGSGADSWKEAGSGVDSCTGTSSRTEEQYVAQTYAQ